jgi:iron complex transport system substrate-binding protein
MVYALGLDPYLIGRSHECDYPEDVLRLPVCSRPRISMESSSAEINRQVAASAASAVSIYDIDSAMLQALRPTHILTQTLCQVCAVSLEDVEAALVCDRGWKGKIVPMGGSSLDEVWRDLLALGWTFGVEEKAAARVAEYKQRMAELTRRASESTGRSVTVIEWIDPLMSAGNWIPELVQMANAVNLFGTAGEHSPWMTWEQLQAADPECIVVAPCGFHLAKTRAEMRNLVQRTGWRALSAVKAGEIYLCDGNQFMSRPGPRLVESLQILCEILHPDRFAPSMQGTGWERYSS